MGDSPEIGVVLGLGVDPSGAVDGIKDFDAELDAATEKWHDDFQKASEATEPLDRSLLGSRESARLLTEELGLHLPRGITSAIAEMMPQIADLSSALLGVFAAKEVAGFIEYLYKARDAANELSKSAKAIHIVADENASAMEKMAKQSLEYARAQTALLNTQIAAGQRNVEALKEHEEGADQAVAALIPLINAYHYIKGESQELKDAETGLDNEYKLRDALVNILGEDMAETNRESAKSAEITERNTLTVRRWQEEMIKAGQEAGKVAAEIAKQNEELAASVARAGKAEIEFALSLERLGIVGEKDLSWLKEYVPELKVATATQLQIKKVYEDLLKLRPNLTEAGAKALAQQLAEIPAIAAVNRETGDQKTIRENLTRAILNQLVAEKLLTQEHANQIAKANGVDLANQKLVVGLKQLKDIQDAFSKSAEDGAQAVIDQTQALGGLAGEVAEDVAGRKIAAEVHGGFDAAMASEEMAKFIASGFTDGTALAASLKYTTSAIAMFSVAGKGSAGTEAGGGGGGGSASRVGGQSGPQAAGAMGSEVPVTPGLTSFGGTPTVPGGTLHIMVVGEAEKSKFIVDAINTGVNRFGMQVSTGTRPKAGR
jgi:hypothetical protein